MADTIFQTLKELGLSSEQTRILFSDRTRDVDNLKVWKDLESGVIYIDDFYTGDVTYIEGNYRSAKIADLKTGKPHFERGRTHSVG